MSKEENLQDKILRELKREHIGVTVFLVNGFQIRGTVTGYDNFVLLMLSDGKQEMIYKHAISTIMTVVPVKL